jgi:hypothetical protein
MANRLSEVGSAFEFYKFRKLKYRILADTVTTVSSNKVDMAVGYFPELPNTSLTYEETSELTPCAHFAALSGSLAAYPQTTPSEWVDVSPSILNNTPVKMYQCNSANSEDPEITQGRILCASTSSSDAGAVSLEFKYVVDFKGISVATA